MYIDFDIFVHMAKANYDLPNDKIEEVMRISGAKSKREALLITLDSFLQRKKVEDLMGSFGKFPSAWKKASALT